MGCHQSRSTVFAGSRHGSRERRERWATDARYFGEQDVTRHERLGAGYIPEPPDRRAFVLMQPA